MLGRNVRWPEDNATYKMEIDMGYWLTTDGTSLEIGAAPHITGSDMKKFRKMRNIPQIALAHHLRRDVKTIRRWEAMGDLPINDPNICREIDMMRKTIKRYVDED
jgi:DNA-binding transcriptional regulator YiaG